MSHVTRLVRAEIGLAILIVLGCLAGCSDGPISPPPPPPPPPPPAGLIVSNAVPGPSSTTGIQSFAVPANSAADEVTYVSLPPGTIPTGSTATIQRVGDLGLITTKVFDGGFDPVPVQAQTSDSIEVVVRDAGGTTVAVLGLVVAARRPPIVVRTDPPRRKTDVPLNSVMVFVFSEPVAAGTLTSSSVQLFRGTTSIAGTVRLLQGTATAAVFQPTAQLTANTDYRLVVTRAVEDLNGDALAEEVATEFTTGATLLGTVASVSIGLLDSTVLMASVGSQWQLTAIARDDAFRVVAGRPVLWSSSNSSVATVSATGLVTALAEGLVETRAEIDGRVGRAVIRVVAGLSPIGSVTLTPESLIVVVGGRNGSLTMVLRDTADQIVQPRPSAWTSSDPAIAIVEAASRGGVVTGLAEGVVRIVAMLEGKSDTSVVTVIAASSVEVSPQSGLAIVGGSVHFAAVARDAAGNMIPDSLLIPDSLYVPFTWTTSDSSVAAFAENIFQRTGGVTGIAAGTATITATAANRTGTATITVGNTAPYARLSAGYEHTCGVGTDGVAWCWGLADYGRLGNGTIHPISVGVPVAVGGGGHRFSRLGVGREFSCGLTPAGSAYCWGSNALGQLGIGSASTLRALVPVALADGRLYVGVSTGYAHACGLTTSGAAYCWGLNYSGQLGDGTTTDRLAPTAVAGGLTFTALDAGGVHTCALTATGAVYCWGSNDAGQLGDGTTTHRSLPVEVAGGLTFTAVSAGAAHTCGLTTAGAAYCWGGGGALGIGTPEGPEFCPVPRVSCSTVPVPVQGDLRWTDLSTSAGGRTCAVTTAGAAYCWGSTPVAVAGGLTLASVSPGAGHTCGVTPAGIAYCWGDDTWGQLGNGSRQNSDVPVKVAGQP